MSGSTPKAIRISSLGAVTIDTGESRIDPSASVIFAAALYLAVEGSHGVTRRHLQGLLWPNCQSDVAGHRLRQSLLKLRQFGFPLVADGKQRVSLNVPVTTDIDGLEEANRDLDLATLSCSVFGSVETGFSGDFQDWFEIYRSKLVARVARMMLKEIARLRASGCWQLVDDWCQALLRHSPENEEAVLALAESLAMRGEKTAAVRCIDNYLATIDSADTNLRVAANVLRRRIADRAGSPSPDVHEDVPLVGRENELKYLANALIRTRKSEPQMCCLVGDAGIGKSRLVSEFAAFAELQGVTCHKIGCRSSDSKRSLSAMLQLIPLLRSARGAIGCSPETLTFLETLTTLRPDKTQRIFENDGLSDPVYSKLYVALTDIIDALSDEVTTLIVIEDCHWMDAASAEVLQQLFDKFERQRVLFILTTRLSEQRSTEGPFGDVERMELTPLNLDASRALVRSIASLRGKHIADSHVEWCVQIAEGNPYFLYELATHWIETGNQQGVPESLSSVLQQRLSRLSQNALQVLQACCILENNSSLDIIESVLGLPAHELLSGINELSLAGMLGSPTSNGSGSTQSRIESKHDLLSERALLQLAPQARCYLHRRAAIVLEQHIAHTADASTLWACAKHWQLAGDTAQALRLTESCARHLLEAELPSEAAEAFSKASQYCLNEVERLRILEGQVLASYQSANWSQVMTLVSEVRQIRNRLRPDSTVHDDFELMDRRAAWQTMDWEDILAKSLHCLNALDAPTVHRMEAGVMSLMMLSLSGNGDSAAAVFAMMRDLAADARSSRTDLILQAEMIYNTCWGTIERAVVAADKLVAEQRQQRNTATLLRSLCNAAITFRVAGAFDSAGAHLHEALEIAERHKIELFKAQALPMLAHMAIELGRIDEARKWLSDLRDLPTTSPDAISLADIHSIDARLALVDGRYEHAIKLLHHELGHLESDPLPHKRAYWNALRIACELARNGRATVGALKSLEKEHFLTRGNPFQAFAAYALYVGLSRNGEGEKAERILAEYLHTYRREKWAAPTHLLEGLQALGTVRHPGHEASRTKSLVS